MIKMRKALLALLASVTVMGTSVVPAVMAETNVFAASEQNADAKEAQKLFSDVKGTYVQLFHDVIFNEKYDQDWLDDSAAVVGKSSAEEAVKILKASVGSDKYGAEAEQGAFCCRFINGAKEITFGENGKIEIATTDGKVITHTYKFLRKDSIGGLMGGYIFESTDGAADEFRYFFLCPDTPLTTYHMEFRYGSDLEDLLKYDSGKYANWLAAGMLKDALAEKDEAMIKNCIALFCSENLGEMASEETTEQRKALAGVWDADLTLYAKDAQSPYKNAKMYCELRSDGTGTTYLDMSGTGDYKSNSYTFFAYDNDGDKDQNSGVYISTGDEDEITTVGKYQITRKDGNTILSFETLDGSSISYTRRDTKVRLTAGKKSLYVKESTKIKAAVVSGSGTTTYKSSNPKIAKVNNAGKVTALKKGTVMITATNNGVSGQIKIRVKGKKAAKSR